MDQAIKSEKKKSKKKREREEAGGDAPKPAKKDKKDKRDKGAGRAPPEANEPEKKKNKKKKTAAAADDGAAVCAAVGDAALARSAPPIQKRLYTEHATLAGMSPAAVAAYQDERGIVVEGSALRPMTAFDQLGCSTAQLHAVKAFAAPSPIQAQCWPLVLSGHDLIGIAATGSGAPLTLMWHMLTWRRLCPLLLLALSQTLGS